MSNFYPRGTLCSGSRTQEFHKKCEFPGPAGRRVVTAISKVRDRHDIGKARPRVTAVLDFLFTSPYALQLVLESMGATRPDPLSKFHAKESAVIYTAVLVRVVPRGAREQGPCSGNPWASTRPMGKPPGRAGQSGSYIYKFP